MLLLFYKTACRAFGAAAVLFCSPLRGSLSKNDVRGFAAHYSGKGHGIFFQSVNPSRRSSIIEVIFEKKNQTG